MANFPKYKGTAKDLTSDEALAKMEHYCAYRERCPQEVYRKMRELGFQGEVADKIFQVLEGDNYVNEERFAYAFAGGKFRMNHWGRVRIRLELQRRAIAPKFIETALEGISEEAYLGVLRGRLEKLRQKYQADTNPLGRSKAAAALIRAGFEPELVFLHL